MQLLLFRQGFNTQPPEGGWVFSCRCLISVSGFNTQPPEGGWQPTKCRSTTITGFNTQPPEGGWPRIRRRPPRINSFNTQPPEGGWFSCFCRCLMMFLFQHAAARRRLDPRRPYRIPRIEFQHAAARRRLVCDILAVSTNISRFNTQPPEGGWIGIKLGQFRDTVSTRSRPKAAGLCGNPALWR